MLGTQDQFDILALYEQYNHAIDAADASAWAATYTEDGVFDSPRATVSGRAALEQYVRAREASPAAQAVRPERHWNADIRIVGEGTQASGSCLLLLSGIQVETGKTVVITSGSYTDALVKTASGWRFVRRTVRTA